MLLAIETSALNQIVKAQDGLKILRDILATEQLRPAIGTHAIHETAKLLWNEKHTALRCELFQLMMDLDPAFLVPAHSIIFHELQRFRTGESIVPFLMGADLEAAREAVRRLANRAVDEEALKFTRCREQEMGQHRKEDQQRVARIQEARERGEIPSLRTFQEVVEFYRPDVPSLIQQRLLGQVDATDAVRLADRLEEFPALRTSTRADMHFMLTRINSGKVPARDKTADCRHVIDASYCSAMLVDDRNLLKTIPLLNERLRTVPWPRIAKTAKSMPRNAGAETSSHRTTSASRHRSEQGRTRDASDLNPALFACIYCPSTTPPTRREHVMSQSLGTFKQNWTLDCVCDDCNELFGNTFELALGRDSREALFRLELGLKPECGALELQNQRIKMTLQDPGDFDGVRLVMGASPDGAEIAPTALPQVGFRLPGEAWRFLAESELTADNVAVYHGPVAPEVKIVGRGDDCDRLRQRLASLGINFQETRKALSKLLTEKSALTVLYDIHNDETIVRAACKIVFNYAAKMIGCATVRQARFDSARRFVRYGEAPTPVATVHQKSVLVGPAAESSRIHVCGLGWDRGYLVGLVSLFNELTYGLRLCEADIAEFPTTCHFLDPLTRTISVADMAGEA